MIAGVLGGLVVLGSPLADFLPVNSRDLDTNSSILASASLVTEFAPSDEQ
jgi:hypothetical protein